MSAAPGGGSRSRGRVSGTARSSGGPSGRRSQFSGTNTPGSSAQPARSTTARGTRGPSSASRGNGSKPAHASGSAPGIAPSRGSWQDRYQALTTAREKERAEAIRQGLIANPEHARSLADAITPVGTCQDMCAEYERLERVVQKDVWPEETHPSYSVFSSADREPDESRMVKKFRRAAAGLEEQLPWDLRPPLVLKRTCDYLFDEVIGNAPSLEKVHYFVWDRTRAIRNDFSIQQVTKPEELSIAVDCYERIARFHILSLHQLAIQPKPYDNYDPQQEREQLDRTLLSLMQYYDDSRDRIPLPNEAEFRAYCVISQLQDPTPDLEDRVQSWPRIIVQDGRVLAALEVYAAACNTMDSQGPLKPRVTHFIAQQDWQRFWTLVASKKVSYLMACVAEIYFNLVRRTVLNALLRAFRQSMTKADQTWTGPTLCHALAFEYEDEAFDFCEQYGFSSSLRADGAQYLDLTSIQTKALPTPSGKVPSQLKSKLVEDKRHHRTLPALINGLSVSEAEALGMILTAEDQHEEDMEETESVGDESEQAIDGPNGPFQIDTNHADSDSLFVPEDREPISGENVQDTKPTIPVMGITTAPKQGFSFGKPSGVALGAPSTSSSGAVSKGSFGAQSSGLFGAPSFPPQMRAQDAPKQRADLFATSSTDKNMTSNLFATTSTGKKLTFDFGPPRTTSESNSGAPTSPITNGIALPKFEPSSFVFKKKTDPKISLTNTGGAPSVFAQPTAASESSAFVWPSSSTSARSTTYQPPELPQSSTFSTFKPATAETAPPSPDQSAFTFGLLPPQPTTQLSPIDAKIPQPQPHAAASPTQGSSTANHMAQPFIANARRPSISTDTRPKHPSPLSNSVHFDELRPSTTDPAPVLSPAVRSFKHLVPRSASVDSQAKSTSTKEPQDPPHSTPPKPDFDSIIRRIAEEITTDPISGFMNQYVEFTVQQVVTEVEQQIEHELVNARADQFRHDMLVSRYSRRWRDLFWSKRRDWQRSRRRERAKKRLDESRSERETDSVRDDDSIMRDLANPATYTCATSSDTSRRQTVGDALRLHENAGTKRARSSQLEELGATIQKPNHKRLKSTNHVDERGRITKPATTPDTHTDILKRSSYLGFSASGKAGSRNTTRSNYFRLKALGLGPTSEPTTSRGMKRRRSEADDISSAGAALSFRSSSPLQFSPREVHDALIMPRPSPVAPPNDADEALFARLNAARASLQESASFFVTDTDKSAELGRSFSSRSSSESPSLARARQEARSRASGMEQHLVTDQDVPAYRLRESRFVPKEHYGKAIERANEIRASRSRELSRPVSRLESIAPAVLSPLSKMLDPTISAKQVSSMGKATSPEALLRLNGSAHQVHIHGEPNAEMMDSHSNAVSHSLMTETPDVDAPALPTSLETLQPSTVGVAKIETWNWNSHDFGQTPNDPWPPNHDFQPLIAEHSNPFSSLGDAPSNQYLPSLAPPWPPNNNSTSLASRDNHDFTIKPSQVHNSLSASFGNTSHVGQITGLTPDENSTTPPETNSFMPSHAASEAMSLLLSDDDDVGSTGTDERTAWRGFADNFGHVNPYAVLSRQGDGDETQDDEQDEAHRQIETEDSANTEGSDVAYLGGEDEAGRTELAASRDRALAGYDGDVSGDAEDFDRVDDAPDGFDSADDETGDSETGDDEESDEEEPEDEEDGVAAPYWSKPETDHGVDPRTGKWRQEAPLNPALQGVGGTVDEAIELSD